MIVNITILQRAQNTLARVWPIPTVTTASHRNTSETLLATDKAKSLI